MTDQRASKEDLDQLAAAALEALGRGDTEAAAKYGKVHERMLEERDADGQEKQ